MPRSSVSSVLRIQIFHNTGFVLFTHHHIPENVHSIKYSSKTKMLNVNLNHFYLNDQFCQDDVYPNYRGIDEIKKWKQFLFQSGRSKQSELQLARQSGRVCGHQALGLITETSANQRREQWVEWPMRGRGSDTFSSQLRHHQAWAPAPPAQAVSCENIECSQWHSEGGQEPGCVIIITVLVRDNEITSEAFCEWDLLISD